MKLMITEVGELRTFGDNNTQVLRFAATVDDSDMPLAFNTYSPRLFPFVTEGVTFLADVICTQRESKRGPFTDRKVVEIYEDDSAEEPKAEPQAEPKAEPQRKPVQGSYGKSLEAIGREIASREANTALMELGRWLEHPCDLSSPQGQLWWATVQKMLGSSSDNSQQLSTLVQMQTISTLLKKLEKSPDDLQEWLNSQFGVTTPERLTKNQADTLIEALRLRVQGKESD
jgi:hypothetical protein